MSKDVGAIERNEQLRKQVQQNQSLSTPKPPEQVKGLHKDLTELYQNGEYQKDIIDRHAKAVALGKELKVGIRNDAELARYRQVADGTEKATGSQDYLNTEENKAKLKEYLSQYDLQDDKKDKSFKQKQYSYWKAMDDGLDAMPQITVPKPKSDEVKKPDKTIAKDSATTVGGSPTTAPSVVNPTPLSTANTPAQPTPVQKQGGYVNAIDYAKKVASAPVLNNPTFLDQNVSGGIATMPQVPETMRKGKSAEQASAELAQQLVDKDAAPLRERRAKEAAALREIRNKYSTAAKAAINGIASHQEISLFNKDGKDYVKIENPDNGINTANAWLRSAMITELAARQKQGYYKDVTAQQMLSHLEDGMVDRKWGRWTGDNAANFMADMREQIPDLFNLYEEKVGNLKKLSNQTKREISVDELNSFSAPELKARVVKGAIGWIPEAVGGIVDAVTPDIVSDKIGDETSRLLGNTLSYLTRMDVTDPMNAAMNAKGVYQDLMQSFADGKLYGTMDNAELSDRIKRLSGHDDAFSKIINDKLNTNEAIVRDIVYNTGEFAGNLAPMGSMNLGFKAGDKAVKGMRYLEGAATRWDDLGKAFLFDGMEGAAKGGFDAKIEAMKDIIAEGMATKEGLKYKDAWKMMINKSVGDYNMGEDLVRHATAFAVNGVFNQDNYDEKALEHSIKTGILFGFTNQMFARTFASGAARWTMMKRNLDPEAFETIRPLLESNIQFATVLSNAIANPVQSAVAKAWEQGNIHDLFDFKQTGTDLVTGMLMGVHQRREFKKQYDVNTYKEAAQVYDAFSKDVSNNSPSSFGDYLRRFGTLHEEIRGIQNKGTKREENFKVTVTPPEKKNDKKVTVDIPDELREIIDEHDVIGYDNRSKDDVEQYIHKEAPVEMPPWLSKHEDVYDSPEYIAKLLSEDIPLPKSEQPVVKTRSSIGDTINEMHKLTTGKDIDGETTLHDIARSLISNVNVNEKVAEPIRKALVELTKSNPKDVRIEIGDIHTEGQPLGAYYDSKDNVIRFGTNNTKGDLSTALGAITEEAMHSATVHKLAANPELANEMQKTMEAIKTHLGEELNTWNSEDASPEAKQAYAQFVNNPRLQEYYLDNVYEFAAGMLNPLTGLHTLAKEFKLPGQRKNKAYDKVVNDLFGGKQRTVIEDFYKHMDELSKVTPAKGEDIHGMPMIFDDGTIYHTPIKERYEAIAKAEESAPIAHLKEVMDNPEPFFLKGSKTDKATTSDIMKIMGTTNNDVVGQRIIQKNYDGSLNPTATLQKALKYADDYINKYNLNEKQAEVMKAQVANYTESLILNKNNDIRVKPLKVDMTTGQVSLFKTADEVNLEAKRTNSPIRINENYRGDGTPVRFWSGKKDTFHKAINNLYSKGRDKHVSKFMSNILSEMKNPEQYEVQHFTDADQYGQPVTTISNKNDNPLYATNVAKTIFKNTGAYMFPHGVKGDNIFSTRMLDNVDVKNKEAFQNHATKVAKETDNWFFHHWLDSYEGGNRSDLAKYGIVTDIAKLLEVESASVRNEPDIHKALAMVIKDELINDTQKNASVAKVAERDGYNQEQLAELVDIAKKFYTVPTTGERIQLNHERNQDPYDMMFEAAHKIMQYTTDFAGKEFYKKSKPVIVDDEAFTQVKLGKYSTKYVGVMGQSRKLKDIDAMKAVLGDKYKDGFNGDKINQEYFKDHNLYQDKHGVYGKSIMLDAEQVESMGSKFPEFVKFAKSFQNDNTDGSTIILNDKWHELLSDVYGKSNTGSLKTSSHYSDDSFNQIFKSALHKPETDNVLNDPEIEQLYGPVLKFIRSMKNQGINELVFTSGIKSSSTRKLKEGEVQLPGYENEKVKYDAKGNILGRVTTGEKAAPTEEVNLQEEALRYVMQGGTVPDIMTTKKYLTGEHGMQFISAPEAGGSNNSLPLGVMNLPITMPGHEYYDANYKLLMQPIENGNTKAANVLEGYESLRKYAHSYDFTKKQTPANYSKSELQNMGSFIEKLHSSVLANLKNDSPEAVLFNKNSEILDVISGAYTKDTTDGTPYANSEKLGALFMYPNLFVYNQSTESGAIASDRSIAKSVMGKVWEDAVMYRVPGKSGTLNSVLFPMLHVKQGIDYRAKKILSDDKLGREQKDSALASLYAENEQIKLKHFDEDGYFKPDSRALIVGKNIIEEINNNGRRQHGDKWQDLEIGHKVFATLNPPDSASSMVPVEIIGISNTPNFIGINPVIAKTMGRDFDADTLGIIHDSPVWENKDGYNSFSQLWDNLDNYGVGFSDKDRVYNGIPQNKLVEMATLFQGGRSKLGQILGVRDEHKGIVPQQGIDNYVNQQDASGDIGGQIGKINNYVNRSQSMGKISTDAQNEAAYVSLAKQLGVVDKNNIMTAKVATKVDGNIVPDMGKNPFTKEGLSLTDAKPFHSPTNDLTSKITEFATEGKFTEPNTSQLATIRKMVASKLQSDSQPAYYDDYKLWHNKVKTLIDGSPLVIYRDSYSKLSDVNKKVALQLNGLAFLNAKRKTLPGEYKVYEGEAGEMKWKSQGGEPTMFVMPRKGELSKYSIDDIFNPDGTYTDEFTEALKRIGAKPEVMIPFKANVSEKGSHLMPKFNANENPVSPNGVVNFVKDISPYTTLGKIIGILSKHGEAESGSSKDVISGDLFRSIANSVMGSSKGAYWNNVLSGMKLVGAEPVVLRESLSPELNSPDTYNQPMPLEAYIANEANKLAREHFVKPESHIHGMPLLDFTSAKSIESSKMRKQLDKESGGRIAEMDNETYRKFYETNIVPYLEGKLGGKLNEDNINIALEALAPSTVERLDALFPNQSTEESKALKAAYLHQALRLPADLLYDQNKSWNTFNAVANPLIRNSDESLVHRASAHKVLLKPDDVVYNGYEVQNGEIIAVKPVLQGQMIQKQTGWHELVNATSVNTLRYIHPHNVLETVKAVGDSDLIKFANTNIDLSKAEELLSSGKLDNLPEVSISSSYDSISNKSGVSTVVNGVMVRDLDDIRSVVSKFYGDDKDMVEVVSGLIHAKEEAHKAADKLQIFAANYDRLSQIAGSESLTAYAMNKSIELKDEIKSINSTDLKSILSIVREPSSTGRALENILPLIDKNSTEYVGLFNKQKQLNNREMLFRVGQKLFGYEGKYTEGLKEKRGGLYESPEMKQMIDTVQKVIKGIYNRHSDYGKDTATVINSFDNSAGQIQADMQKYQARLGDVVLAMKDVVNEQSLATNPDMVLDNSKWSDITHSTQQLSDYFQKLYKRHLIGNSHVALESYLDNPDESPLAHNAMTSILSRASGNDGIYNTRVNIPEFLDEVNTGLKRTGNIYFKDDTGQVKSGQVVMGIASKSDGSQMEFKGRFLGASVPPIISKSLNPYTFKEDIYKKKGDSTYLTFYDEDTKRVFHIDANQVNSIIAKNIPGMLDKRMDRKVSDRIKQAELLEHISKKFMLGENEDTGVRGATISKDAIREGTARIVEPELREQIEKALLLKAKTSVSSNMYLGGNFKKRALTDLGLIGLGSGVAMINPALGATIAFGASLDLMRGGMKQIVKQASTVIGNKQGGREYQRMNYGLLPNFNPAGTDYTNLKDAQMAKVLAKSGTTGFINQIKEQQGISAASSVRNKLIEQTLLMSEMEAKLNDVFTKEYGDWRTAALKNTQSAKGVISESVGKENKDYTASMMYNHSFLKFLSDKHPELLSPVKDDYIITHNGDSVSLESATGDTKGKTYDQIRSQFLNNVSDLEWGIMEKQGLISKIGGKALKNMLKLSSRIDDTLTHGFAETEIEGASNAMRGGYKFADNWDKNIHPVAKQNFAEYMVKINNGDYSTNFMSGTLFSKAMGTFTQFNKEMKLNQTVDYKRANDFYKDVAEQLEGMGLTSFISEHGRMFGLSEGSLRVGNLPIVNKNRKERSYAYLPLVAAASIGSLLTLAQKTVLDYIEDADDDKMELLGSRLDVATTLPMINGDNDMVFKQTAWESVPANIANTLSAYALANLGPTSKRPSVVSAEKKQIEKVESLADLPSDVMSLSPAQSGLLASTVIGVNQLAAYMDYFNTSKQLKDQFHGSVSEYKTILAHQSAMYKVNVDLAKKGMSTMSFVPGVQFMNVASTTTDNVLGVTKAEQADIRKGKK